MSFNLDNAITVSSFPPFAYGPTVTGSLVLVGNVFPPGFSYTFSTTVNIGSTTNRVDLYGSNSLGQKQCLSTTGFPAIYQNKAGELAQQYITYGSGTITYNLTITNNTASSITLIDQTIYLEANEIVLPF